MTRRQKIILITILAVGAFLLFFRLSRHDMLGDDAHYAFRSIGYFDYLASKTQTTPVQWFGYRPAWSLLSFHDHPPLYFLIQSVFFKIFGWSVTVSRLSSALAALGSVLVLFFWARRISSAKAGLLAAGFAVLNAYFIWMGRVGLLESVFVFFLLLGLYFLEKKSFPASGLFLGLAFLTKYTLLFALPGILLYLLWKQREIFSNRRFWQGVLFFVLVISPVIFYNIALYQSRGHFDVQFSDLLGHGSQDRTNLTDRVGSISFSPQNVVATLAAGFSWPYLGLVFLALAAGLYLAAKKNQPAWYLPIFVFLSLFVMFSVIGNAPRWLGVMSPFAALLLALVFERFIRLPAAAVLLGVFAGFCLFYNINTNHLREPVGGKYLYAYFRLENLGYNQLDKYLSSKLRDAKPTSNIRQATRGWWYGDINQDAMDFSTIDEGSRQFNSLVIIDSQNIWFPTFWAVEKWKFHHRFAIMTADEFLQVVDDENRGILNQIGFESMYYIKSGPEIMRTADYDYHGPDPVLDAITKGGGAPEQVIKDDRGRDAFFIYNVRGLEL